MAVKTIFEVYDLIANPLNMAIFATDKEGTTKQIITDQDAKSYVMRKYASRKYPVLKGAPATLTDGITDFDEAFDLWVKNRQHNIDLQYQALFDYDYSPIENYDRYELSETVLDGETTYGRTDTESGTDSITYGKKNTESGKDTLDYKGSESTVRTGHEDNIKGGKETVEMKGSETDTQGGTETHEIQKSGFNSPDSYTKDTKETDTYSNRTSTKSFTGRKDETTFDNRSDVLEYHDVTDTHGFLNRSDETTYGRVDTLSGSDSTTYGKKNTQGGKDERDDTTTITSHIHGNIGVTTSTAMINELVESRMMSLAEMLLDNFINDYTSYC